MKVLVMILGIMIALAVLGAGFMLSGLYNVAANVPHSALTEWLLHSAMEHSVALRARNMDIPPLTDPALIRQGGAHYHDMCAICHGGPGVAPHAIGQGLNPAAPNLIEPVHEKTAGELFWIVRNGIKMSGMPSFGATHSEEQLWAMVAFVEQLPQISPSEYLGMKAEGEDGRE